MTNLSEISFSPVVWRFFDRYLCLIIAFRFYRVSLGGALGGCETRRPVILISNHSTWWDGFFMRLVQKKLFPGRPLYTVVLATEQPKLPFFFRKLGVLLLGPGTQQTLSLVRNLLARSKAAQGGIVISYFPQGKIYPSSKRPLQFKRGIEVLANALDAAVIPVGIHIEPMQHKKPTAFIAVGAPHLGASATELERAVERVLDSLSEPLRERGEEFDFRNG